MTAIASEARAFIAKGGVVNLSFGGAINVADPADTQDHVQRACKDTTQLSNLITTTLQQFNTHNVEFDIEGDDLMQDAGARTRLAQAIAIVKKNIPDLHITYTLATNPDGLPSTGVQQVQALKDAGVQLDVLSLMTMDMVPDNVAKSSISAIQAGAKQLETIYNLPAGSGLSRMGVIPMPGKDDNGAMFSLEDAHTLATFAIQNKIAYVSYWEFNRDIPGSDANFNLAISNVANYAFFNTMRGVLGSGSANSSPSNASSTHSSIAHLFKTITKTVTATAYASPAQNTKTVTNTVTQTASPTPLSKA
jgi:hypothetical protein